jgi:hypothetical protein
VVDVRRLQKFQAVTPQIEHVAIAHSLDRSPVAPMGQVDGSAEFAGDKHRTGCVPEEAVHPAAPSDRGPLRLRHVARGSLPSPRF